MTMHRDDTMPSHAGWQCEPLASRSEWDEVLAADPAALPTQTPRWVAGICAAAPYDNATRLYRRPDGSRLVLPLVRRRARPGPLTTAHSVPAGYGYGGILAEGRPPTPADVSAVVADLRRTVGGSVLVTPNPLVNGPYERAAGWTSTRPGWAQVLDLSGGFDEVWSRRFRSSARQAVRKAERSGISVVRDTSGRLLPQFHEMYQKSVVRWTSHNGLPPALALWRASRHESLERLQKLAGAMRESWVTWMAFVDDAPAAGIVVLHHGAQSHYWHGAMDLGLAGPVRANHLLHKLAIEEACARGDLKYSMGMSKPDSGLARFKASLGAAPAPFATYLVEQLPMFRTTDLLGSAARRAFAVRRELQQRRRGTEPPNGAEA